MTSYAIPIEPECPVSECGASMRAGLVTWEGSALEIRWHCPECLYVTHEMVEVQA